MANIETLIEGYKDMTPEERLAAVEKFDFDDHAAELEKAKSAITKANADAAEWKRKHHDLLDEDERKRQQEAEERENILSELETLRKEKTIAGYKASYMANGYDEALAEATAQALADGDMAKVFANQKAHMEAHDKALKAEMLGNTPKPQGGGTPSGGVTLEAFRKMSASDRAKFAQEHPDEYNNLYGGK